MNKSSSGSSPARLPLLLALSFAIFVLTHVFDQAVRWTDPVAGIINGLFQMIFNWVAWLFFVLPVSLLIHALYRRRGWKRHHTPAVLAPAFGCVALMLAGLVFDPPTASNRFYRTTGVSFPSLARNVRKHFSGGGLADYGDYYYFRCEVKETNRLIQELDLSPDDDSWPGETPFSGWPGPSTWKNPQTYRGGRKSWNYYLMTDESREQVYLFIFCT